MTPISPEAPSNWPAAINGIADVADALIPVNCGV
jgi:hypothetical protein